MDTIQNTTTQDQFDRYEFHVGLIDCGTIDGDGRQSDTQRFWTFNAVDRTARPQHGDRLLLPGGSAITVNQTMPWIRHHGVIYGSGLIPFEHFPAGIDRQTCIGLLPSLTPDPEYIANHGQ